MLLALVLTLIGFTIALKFLPLEQLGMSSGFGLSTAAIAFAVLAPFTPLGAALMTVIASFTRSYKEAQTYLGLVVLVPTLPVILASLMNVKPSVALMWIPSLSQHLLVTSLIRQEPIEPAMAVVSTISTLSFSALLAWAAIGLYKREALLG
jgi:sodium transport system permease protein